MKIRAYPWCMACVVTAFAGFAVSGCYTVLKQSNEYYQEFDDGSGEYAADAEEAEEDSVMEEGTDEDQPQTTIYNRYYYGYHPWSYPGFGYYYSPYRWTVAFGWTYWPPYYYGYYDPWWDYYYWGNCVYPRYWWHGGWPGHGGLTYNVQRNYGVRQYRTRSFNPVPVGGSISSGSSLSSGSTKAGQTSRRTYKNAEGKKSVRSKGGKAVRGDGKGSSTRRKVRDGEGVKNEPRTRSKDGQSGSQGRRQPRGDSDKPKRSSRVSYESFTGASHSSESVSPFATLPFPNAFRAPVVDRSSSSSSESSGGHSGRRSSKR